MKVLRDGHTYELQGNKGTESTVLKFYLDPEIHDGEFQAGTTNQEVLRALIQRLGSINKEQPWGLNVLMIEQWRQHIILHEMRAAERKGYCGLRMSVLLSYMNDEGGIEGWPPREDGHIFPLSVHLASECGGKCESLDVG